MLGSIIANPQEHTIPQNLLILLPSPEHQGYLLSIIVVTSIAIAITTAIAIVTAIAIS